MESNQPFGLFRPALIRLSYPTREIADCRFSIADWLSEKGHDFQAPIGIRQSAINLGPPFLLGMHLLHDVTIIVYIHEEVLAPLGARLGVMAKHHAL